MQIANVLGKKMEFFTKNIVFSISTIIIISLVLRLYNFPFNIPLTLDAQGYFSYAIDMSIVGKFPTDYDFPNNGWPAFLSIFFYIFHFANFMDFMHIQRFLTVTLSVFTIIIIYFLCLRFFEKKIAIVCSMLFAFEPKIITNSTLGITEPLFVLLGATALFLFLSESKKWIYASFVILGLFTLVRYEGFLLVLPFSIMFFIRFRRERKVVLQYLIPLSLFALTILPMSYVRSEIIGNDGIISQVSAGPQYYQHVSQYSKDPSEIFSNLIVTGITNLIKYIGWSMVPVFLCFIPFGIYAILKNRNFKNYTLIISLFTLLLPAFYAYSRNVQETRYLLVIYPIFCIFAGFTIKILFEKFKKEQLIVLFLFVVILSSSIIFLEIKKIDYQHEREAYDIAKEIVKRTKIINHSYAEEYAIQETRYYRVANIAVLEKFPVLSSTIKPIQFVETKDYDNLEKYLEFGKKSGLEYLILDDNTKQPDFFRKVFNNEQSHPFLNKEFDSHDYNYKYHVKIFKIDYDKLRFNSDQSSE
jgi:4-amino-4-deoxy-L-arabinose transferase-like glycosyltransferase